jgi:hypothetical protein
MDPPTKAAVTKPVERNERRLVVVSSSSVGVALKFVENVGLVLASRTKAAASGHHNSRSERLEHFILKGVQGNDWGSLGGYRIRSFVVVDNTSS